MTHTSTPERPPYLPGDPLPEAETQRMIRVDHAGEYGAVRIYDGQLAVAQLLFRARGRARDEIRRMAGQEQRHLAAFDELVRARHVRPTVLQPLWHVAGYALGAASALLGTRAAMACTVAVEEVIDEHYRAQAERLGTADPALSDPELKQTIEAFRADELAHRQTAIEYGATDAFAYELISAFVKTGARLAIWLSTRL
jgi:ubiquinone biosynthesis monooxygenase Coq7